MLHGAMTNAMYPRIALCSMHLLRCILHRGGGKWFDILIHKSVVVASHMGNIISSICTCGAIKVEQYDLLARTNTCIFLTTLCILVDK